MESVFQSHLLIIYSDSDLINYIRASPALSTSSCNVFALSFDLVAKYTIIEKLKDELAAISLARQLHIRVPIIRRVVETENVAYLIMDRIHGLSLEEIWTQIGWGKTFSLAFQLQQFIGRMRTQTSPTAGSLIRGECDSMWLNDYYRLRPHARPEAITQFLRFMLQYDPKKRKVSEFNVQQRRNRVVPATPSTLVFTHQDLAPRNLLVDSDNNLWIVDWEFSGWYPFYFESVSMQNFWIPTSWSRFARVRWWIFSWISAGIYEQEREALELVRFKCRRFPLARKEIVLQPGAHADAMHLRKADL